jgi:threonylcarbamoyladenosine tRNA methylthiotransferase MtaB
MKTCAFYTLGCKVNQYETEELREKTLALGLCEVPHAEKADLYVVNTCCVTRIAEAKSRQALRRFHRQNPAATVVATGCYADRDPRRLTEIPGVHLVMPNSRKEDLPRKLAELCGLDPGPLEGAPPGIHRFHGHTRAFIKIQDGCDAFCSYCIVPYVRGRPRCRDFEAIVREAGRLAENGHREVVVTGIHLGRYREPGPGGRSLPELLSALDAVEGIRRIRFSSIEPLEIGERLLKAMAASEKFCPHFHISLQSGDDEMLRKMNRPYRSDEYLAVVERIREHFRLPSFSTDVIVGFPGEKEHQFANTLDLCRRVVFNKIHVFPYSHREGTEASRMSGKTPNRIIKERKGQLIALAEDLGKDYKRHFLGEIVEVLVEGRCPTERRLHGFTPRYVRVYFDGPGAMWNTLQRVRVERVFPDRVEGEHMRPPCSRRNVDSTTGERHGNGCAG